MPDEELILSLLKESRDAVKELAIAVTNLEKGIVGQVNCDAHRRDFNRRLTKVEEVCTTYQATRGGLISESDLMAAKDDAIQHFGTRYNDLEARMTKHEDRDRLWDLTWDTVKGNSVLKGAFGVWFLAIALIAYDRIRVFAAEYGMHTAIVVVGIIIVGLIMAWCLANRGATTKATKKLMGLQ